MPESIIKNMRSTYTFKADGTYNVRYINDGDTCVTEGEWRAESGRKEILTSGNRFLPPHDKDGVVADHPIPIVKLDGMALVLTECLVCEVPGTSYYARR